MNYMKHFPKEYLNYLIYIDIMSSFVPLQMEPNSEPKLRLLPDWYRWISRCRPWVGMDWQIHPGLHRVRSWSLDIIDIIDPQYAKWVKFIKKY